MSRAYEWTPSRTGRRFPCSRRRRDPRNPPGRTSVRVPGHGAPGEAERRRVARDRARPPCAARRRGIGCGWTIPRTEPAVSWYLVEPADADPGGRVEQARCAPTARRSPPPASPRRAAPPVTCAGVAVGWPRRYRATVPVTCGVAIDVPDMRLRSRYRWRRCSTARPRRERRGRRTSRSRRSRRAHPPGRSRPR